MRASFEYDNIYEYRISLIKSNPWVYRYYYIASKNNKYGLIDSDTMMPLTDFIYDSFESLYDKKLKVKKEAKYAFYDIKNNKMGKFKYEDIRIGKFETEWTGKNMQVKHRGVWYYNNPAKIAGTCLGYTVFYSFAIATAPVTVPAAFGFMGLSLWSLYPASDYKEAPIPNKIIVKENVMK